ncbi:protein chibby homolog 1 [Zootermopsis nevadensis]|uniref:Chibby-like protein 1 n=1 Tax=Zootermopsis nevadensis TaxID=136037 RepID=A0A067R8X9_ZOONE|nr:protein chibby homolog 1 [Zootermopsis nevadensis]KDR19058.1 Chibby-like protein 1 [Zootermopsis nevadensis]
MSFFSNKFSHKKPAPRRVPLPGTNREFVPEDLGLEIGPVKLKLGDQESIFVNGEWVPESGPESGTHKENRKLRQCIQKLEDENNLLKLKFEILLDMLTQKTAESLLQDNQIKQTTPKGSSGHFKNIPKKHK